MIGVTTALSSPACGSGCRVTPHCSVASAKPHKGTSPASPELDRGSPQEDTDMSIDCNNRVPTQAGRVATMDRLLATLKQVVSVGNGQHMARSLNWSSGGNHIDDDDAPTDYSRTLHVSGDY